MIKNEFVQYDSFNRPETTHVRQFEDMSELVDLADKIDTDHSIPACSSRVEGLRDSRGTDTLRETIDLAYYGWPEGVARIDEELEQINASSITGPSLHTDMLWDVHGDEADVGAFLSGEPENMIRFESVIAPLGRTVEILVNAGHGGQASAEYIALNGAAIVAAVNALQTGGYSVGVTAATSTRAKNPSVRDTFEYYVPILRPGDYMDKDALAFALMHPSFPRRLIFAAQESESPEMRERMGFYRGGGYGYANKKLTHYPPADHLVINAGRPVGWNSGPHPAQSLLNQLVVICDKHEKHQS